MSVKIVAITQPLLQRNPEHKNDVSLLSVDEFVAYVARVSNSTNQNNTLTAPKLLKYLTKHKHWSPFEIVNIVQEINTTRDIGRQILRHRSFSFQEFSQRYANPTETDFIIRDARLQDEKNRQNSIENNDYELQMEWTHKQENVAYHSKEAYNWAIKNGIAKEQARVVLPEGLTTTRMYMNGNLRSWIHYCQLRMGVETQKEHRLIAKEAWENIIVYFPSLKDIMEVNNE